MPGGKIGAFVVLLGLSVLAAGAFGAVHNQLSYSVGPTYFTELKFQQFQIPTDTGPRAGAAVVGWQASWWMGLIVGLPVMGFGLMRAASTGALWAGGVGAIFTVVITAAICGLLGLALGFAVLASGLEFAALSPPGAVSARDFITAGLMHEGSYLGGILGALLAFWAMARATRRKETSK